MKHEDNSVPALPDDKGAKSLAELLFVRMFETKVAVFFLLQGRFLRHPPRFVLRVGMSRPTRLILSQSAEFLLHLGASSLTCETFE